VVGPARAAASPVARAAASPDVRAAGREAAVRIVAGRFRGAQLATPETDAVRPSADRLRETLFNVLAHGYGNPVVEARVLDLFAGTGSLGLEAVSRGAAFCLFVDDGAPARALIRANVEKLALTGATKLWRRDATDMGPCAPMPPFDLAFLDPPYGKGLAERALTSLAAGRWLAPGAVVVVEEASGVALAPVAGFVTEESRPVGAGTLHIHRFAG
jgi:16S rRNA (guanine966-N2)-methyltransferase